MRVVDGMTAGLQECPSSVRGRGKRQEGLPTAQPGQFRMPVERMQSIAVDAVLIAQSTVDLQQERLPLGGIFEGRWLRLLRLSRIQWPRST